jgi:hypothetical protein
MKIMLESTPEVGKLEVDGVLVPARIWVGTTESGIGVIAFITRLGVPEGCDASELERELLEPPTTLVLED